MNYSTYGTDKLSNFKIFNISQNENYSKFDIKISLPGSKEKLIKNIKVPLIGLHNIRNSTAAAAVAITRITITMSTISITIVMFITCTTFNVHCSV